MHPKLFDIRLPGFLAGWLGTNTISFYTYACCIVLGAVIACIYLKKYSKIELSKNISNSFFYFCFIAGFVGGKLFFYLERPMYYLSNPKLMLNNFGGGFVCYGSVLFVIGYAIFYTRKHVINTFGFLDILAVGCSIPMATGRIGCFFGGCCYGKPTQDFFAVVFPLSSPTAVHPTQLYESLIMLIIVALSLVMRKYKTVAGQVFYLNIGLYAIGRFFLEFLRGDLRGFFFNGFISHAQTIAIIILFISAFFLYKTIKQSSSIITKTTTL